MVSAGSVTMSAFQNGCASTQTLFSAGAKDRPIWTLVSLALLDAIYWRSDSGRTWGVQNSMHSSFRINAIWEIYTLFSTNLYSAQNTVK